MILTDLISMVATTGTAGSTLTTTGMEYTAQMHGAIMIGIIALLFIIAHYLDRKYSRPLYQESKLKEEEEVQT